MNRLLSKNGLVSQISVSSRNFKLLYDSLPSTLHIQVYKEYRPQKVNTCKSRIREMETQGWIDEYFSHGTDSWRYPTPCL